MSRTVACSCSAVLGEVRTEDSISQQPPDGSCKGSCKGARGCGCSPGRGPMVVFVVIGQGYNVTMSLSHAVGAVHVVPGHDCVKRHQNLRQTASLRATSELPTPTTHRRVCAQATAHATAMLHTQNIQPRTTVTLEQAARAPLKNCAPCKNLLCWSWRGCCRPWDLWCPYIQVP